MAKGRSELIDPLDPVVEDVYEPASGAQVTDGWPHPGDPLVELPHLQIPELDMDDPGRRSLDQNPRREVGVLGDDR